METNTATAMPASAPAPADDTRNLFVPTDLSTADAAAVARVAAGDDSDSSGSGVTIYMLSSGTSTERKRLHMQHIVFRCVLGGHFHTPQRSLLQGDGGGDRARVLDVGCGPGHWSLDMSKAFPKADFVGVDIATYGHHNLPANVTFETKDVTNGLDFPDNTFDLVHQRSLMLAYKTEQWPAVLKELIRVTKPGGYIQLVE
ncbi:hypothetical protein HK405_012000, partial [Cladochytrium tenue]